MTLEQLWAVHALDPVQPHSVSEMCGLHEKLLRDHRRTSSRVIGQRISPMVLRAVDGQPELDLLQQWVRVAGVALWEREHGRIADSIGI
jgi:hypothetical protein